MNRQYQIKKLLSVGIVNMLPSIENQRGIQAVHDIPNTRAKRKTINRLLNRRTQVMFI